MGGLSSGAATAYLHGCITVHILLLLSPLRYVRAPVCACVQLWSSLVVRTSSASIAPAYKVLPACIVGTCGCMFVCGRPHARLCLFAAVLCPDMSAGGVAGMKVVRLEQPVHVQSA